MEIFVFLILIFFIISLVSISKKSLEMVNKLEKFAKIKKEEAMYLRSNILNLNVRNHVKNMYSRHIEMNNDDITNEFIKEINSIQKEELLKNADAKYIGEGNINPIKEKRKRKSGCRKL